jgi:short-subunit dehydrogenase
MYLPKIQARLAFISGAGSGLGKELARELAKRKIPLLLTSKDPQKLHLLEKELQKMTTVSSQVADLSIAQDLESLLKRLRLESPDLVINNAGIGLYGKVLSFPLEQQMQILKINVDALVQISIESARTLQKRKERGTIMNVSSTAGLFTYPSFALYAASKRFAYEFSLSLDEELSSQGIRVLSCLLGRFASDFRYHASLQKSSDSASSLSTMSLAHTARSILRQIEKQKGHQIIDGRYQILTYLSKLAPRRWIAKILQKQIERMK